MKKWILRGILAVVVLVVVGIAVLYFARNSLVRAGVTRGGKYATDQNTSLNAADLSLGGSLALSNLDIDNLKGYSTPKLLSMKSCGVSVQTSSLLTPTVVVHNITIDGLEIFVEQNGVQNNLNDLLAVIQKKTPAAGESQNTSPGKNLKIGVVKLTGSKVHVRGNIMQMDLDLPDLEMVDPTNPDGRPMKIADLVGKILIQLAKQVMENPAVPGNIKDAMKNADAIVKNLRGELDKNVKELGSLKDLKVPDVKGLQDSGKNIQDLNPFGKKEGK